MKLSKGSNRLRKASSTSLLQSSLKRVGTQKKVGVGPTQMLVSSQIPINIMGVLLTVISMPPAPVDNMALGRRTLPVITPSMQCTVLTKQLRHAETPTGIFRQATTVPRV